jgi:DNA-binding Xre family transcriptional regulator
MITWNLPAIARHMERRKIANAHQLHEYTGLTIPTAYNVLSGGPLQRIEVATLETLASAFKCSPWNLLDFKRG